MNKAIRSLIAALLVMVALPAGSAESVPGAAPTRALIKTQEKADALFEQEKYGRALTIYKKDLAPIGDKFAQYMVGYIYLAGKGVPEDTVRASAWYRLAAERDNPEFTRVRDRLLALMSDKQRALSDAQYVDLRRSMGDAVLISRLLRDDLYWLEAARRSPSIPEQDIRRTLAVSDSRPEISTRRMELRAEYLSRLVEADPTMSGPEREAYHDVVLDVRRALDVVREAD